VSSVFPARPLASLADLSTPCLVLERGRLERNLGRMDAAVRGRGVRLRPHLKTAKSADVARLAAPPPEGALTVSTLREAEYFAHHGWTDLFLAVCLSPGKFARAAALHRQGVGLVTMVDHPEAAAALTAFAAGAGLGFRTVIEVDCGEHRGGLPPESDELVATARALGPHFAGVATHGGQSYAARSAAETAAVAIAEVGALRAAAVRLHAAGFPSAILSLGSSPTALAATDLTGITDVRAGVYMFWDAFQAGIGACRLEDVALTVLAEIIGRPSARPNEFLIDAGAFALSKDISTAALGPEKDAGYGLVCDLAGTPIPGLRVTRVWQEHGLVKASAPLDPARFRIGDRVRILPNHACPTAAAHDRYFVVDGSPAVLAEWPRVNGW
jgi:D-serine deaminase-like pyridoxal phosphate-dependent protein